MKLDNRRRLFAELVSIEAWHEPFSISEREVGVFVEASFAEARIGGDDPELPFTFRLRLRRALLTITGEHPLQLKRDSVSRSLPTGEVKLSAVRDARAAMSKELTAQGKLSPRALAAQIAGLVKANSQQSLQEISSIEKCLPEIISMPRPAGSRAYMWDLEPTFASYLEGQPWDPVSEPRVQFHGFKADDPLQPAISITLSCRVADLDIDDLVPKDASLSAKLSRIGSRAINEAAAVQHIKKVLEHANLEASDMNNRFQKILLADIIARPESS